MFSGKMRTTLLKMTQKNFTVACISVLRILSTLSTYCHLLTLWPIVWNWGWLAHVWGVRDGKLYKTQVNRITERRTKVERKHVQEVKKWEISRCKRQALMAHGLAERKRAEQSPWRTRQTSGRSRHCGKRILQTSTCSVKYQSRCRCKGIF